MTEPIPIDDSPEAQDPDEFVPCPRHGTHCFPEFRGDLASRVECAIGLGDQGPAGVKATADRIMMMIEDHVLAGTEQLRHRLANPCDGECCEEGGAGHCHRCAEAEADELLAERDRLRAENRLLRALQNVPAGSCHRTTTHPPHRWLASRATQHCPGLGPDSAPAGDRPGVAYEFGFERMEPPDSGPMMIGRPVDEIRAAMADKRAAFPEVRYALRRRLVGPWVTVDDD